MPLCGLGWEMDAYRGADAPCKEVPFVKSSSESDSSAWAIRAYPVVGGRFLGMVDIGSPHSIMVTIGVEKLKD